jgi:hypothetical protein
MSDSTEIVRDQRNGRFISGCKPGPGRRVGSRNKLTEAFATDLRLAWERDGASVLERVARDEPGTLLKVVASLMPRDVDIDVSGAVDVGDFARRFRHAVALLHDQPQVKTVEHAKGKQR